MSESATLALRAGKAIDGGLGGSKSDGTRWGSRAGKVPMARTKRRTKCARSSIGRRVLILVVVREFQGRGPVRGFLHLAGLSESGALKE